MHIIERYTWDLKSREALLKADKLIEDLDTGQLGCDPDNIVFAPVSELPTHLLRITSMLNTIGNTIIGIATPAYFEKIEQTLLGDSELTPKVCANLYDPELSKAGYKHIVYGHGPRVIFQTNLAPDGIDRLHWIVFVKADQVDPGPRCYAMLTTGNMEEKPDA